MVSEENTYGSTSRAFEPFGFSERIRECFTEVGIWAAAGHAHTRVRANGMRTQIQRVNLE